MDYCKCGKPATLCMCDIENGAPKKTEIIVRKDNSIYGEYDYIDTLLLLLRIIKGEIKEQLYFRNEHGGIDIIDEFGCSYYKNFKGVSELLREIVKAQIKKRMKNNKAEIT